jgi:hypothetical protein
MNIETKGGEPAEVTRDTLRIGGRYNWKNQPERLIYMGLCEPRNGRWHQFAKVDAPTVCWCEVRDDDLSSFEETPVAAFQSKACASVGAVTEGAIQFEDDTSASMVGRHDAHPADVPFPTKFAWPADIAALAAPAAAVPESPAACDICGYPTSGEKRHSHCSNVD